MAKLKLSTIQRERISEVFGNISVAWFSAGVISPIFFPPQTIFDFLYTFVVSLLLSVVFLVLSLLIIKGVK